MFGAGSLLWPLVLAYLKVLGPALVFASPLFAMLLPDGGLVRKILTFRIPLPVFVIAGLVLYAWLNQHSAAIEAARKATRELVAGADLAARDAQILKLQDDIALVTMLKDAAFKRAMAANEADVAAQRDTDARIAKDDCKGCARWTEEDLQWLDGR
jgi:hypothetical protein